MHVKLTKAQQNLRIANGKALAEVMRSILKRDNLLDRGKEHFWVVGLDDRNLLLYVELISLGSKRATVVEPMDIFRLALQKGSATIILVHNHPRGTLQPSVPDVELTAQLYQVGELLELSVVDHLIISEAGFYSFAEGGLMAELAETKKYLLSSKAQERLKAEAKAIGRLEGEKVGEAKGVERVALQLKAKGVAISIIAQATGLSLAKVKGLKGPKTRA
jgi:DNA repair protein RadC